MRPTIGTVEEIAGFLARFPPYDTLGRDDLLRIAAAVTLRSYPAGTDILIEDGPPAAGLFVIRSGSAELRHQDEVVDILEPGETFGHPSLLTGMAAAFTVRSHEDATCYLIGPEQALEVELDELQHWDRAPSNPATSLESDSCEAMLSASRSASFAGSYSPAAARACPRAAKRRAR